MTAEEFNIKYDAYIKVQRYENKFGDIVEQKFGGLEIDIPSVTRYLDNIFETLVQIPNFTYSQIKLKFNQARFYTNLESSQLEYSIEKQINELVKEFDKQQEL